MSKVFDSLTVAEEKRKESELSEPGVRNNVYSMGPSNLQYWTPEAPAPEKKTSNRSYVIAIILLVASLLAMGIFVLMPQLRIGRGGDYPLERNRAAIELAIQNKQKTHNSTSSSPTDPVNLSIPFEPATDSANPQQSGEEELGALTDDPQASMNGAPVQAQIPVQDDALARDTAPAHVYPPPKSARPIPEKGKIIITKRSSGSGAGETASSSRARPAPGSKRDLENKFRLALFHQKNGEILKAYQLYDYVLGYDPYHIEAHNNLGLIFQDIGKYEESLKEFAKVLAVDPQNVQAINNGGVTYYKMRNYTAAVTRFEAALEIDPNNAESYANLGLVYTQLDRFADAKAVFLKVLAINPKHSETHYNLAGLYEKMGDIKDAIFYYQKFLSYSTDTYGPIIKETEEHVAELYRDIESEPRTAHPKKPLSKIPL